MGDAVDPHLFAEGGDLRGGGSPFGDQGDLQAHRAILAHELGDHPGEGHGIPPGGPVDQLPVAPGAEGVAGGGVSDGLEEVGLPLGVPP
jgi:hypothetical protein